MKLYERYSQVPAALQLPSSKEEQEALHKIEKAPFDLVITDIRMPGLSGQELTRAMRKLRPELPVIWITASRSADINAEAKRLEVICCLDKPLTVAQIRRVVPQVLEGADRQIRIAAAGT